MVSREGGLQDLFDYTCASMLYSVLHVFRRSSGKLLPVVRFLNGREEVIVEEYFKATMAGVGECSRLQVDCCIRCWVGCHSKLLVQALKASKMVAQD